MNPPRPVRCQARRLSRPLLLAVLSLAPALGATESDVGNYPPLQPWMQAQLLNKAAIAEDQMQRLYGLREAGNPQLQPGTILEEAELGEPREDDRFRQELRARQLASVSSRELRWSARSDSKESRTPARAAPRAREPQNDGFGATQGIVFVSTLFLALWLFKKRA
ncbi:MAG: hypothetical protein AB7O52_07810 [Planctomycetota bacterium]